MLITNFLRRYKLRLYAYAG